MNGIFPGLGRPPNLASRHHIGNASRETAMTSARIIASALAAAFTSLVLTGPAPALAAGPEDSLNPPPDILITTRKDARTLGKRERYAKIEPIIRQLFDLPL